MKDKILFAIAMMCTMLLTSCGGGGDSDDGTPSGPSTYSMNVTVEASAYSQTIELSKLRTNIASATCSATWVTLTRLSYTSGSPKIMVEVSENTASTSRSGIVTVTATDGNVVKINITQKGATATGNPETKDEVSDQQPYSMDMEIVE